MAVVLVVDDDRELRMLYEMRLEGAGHEVLLARHGEEGLAIAQERIPDVILLDYQMPIMGGDVMLEKLREASWGKEIKVIMMSGLNIFRRKKFDAANHILHKPITGLELIKSINKVLEVQV